MTCVADSCVRCLFCSFDSFVKPQSVEPNPEKKSTNKHGCKRWTVSSLAAKESNVLNLWKFSSHGPLRVSEYFQPDPKNLHVAEFAPPLPNS